MAIPSRTLLFVVAVCLAATASADSGSPPKSTRLCLRLAPRQQRLVAKIFAHQTCDIAWITTEIEQACSAGLCAGLKRRMCIEKIRWKLEDELFPEFCEDSCVPSVCEPDSCRSYLDSSLPFPKNCPQKCKATSGCPNKIKCKPLYPRRCPHGTSLDESICSCVSDYECRKDSECDDVNACRPGLCTDTGICKTADLMPNCCVNDMERRNTDAECTPENPLCGGDNRIPVGRDQPGTTCYFCENDRPETWKDNGCNMSVPLCGGNDREVIPADDLGDRCYTCLNDAEGTGQDLGCSPEAPQCADGDREPIGEGQLGDACYECLSDDQCPAENLCRPGVCSLTGSCSVGPLTPNCCINDMPSAKTDTECEASAPFCGGDLGMPVGEDEAGTTCYVCENDRSGANDDNGCPEESPLCGGANGNVIPHDDLGEACYTCINDQSGGDVDTGCSPENPLCGDASGGSIDNGSLGSGCFTCLNDEDGAGEDSGCDALSPICGLNPVADGSFGDQCNVCLNDQTDGTQDTGCSAAAPLCRAADGSDLAPGAAGQTCVPCGSVSKVAVCFAVDESGSICGNTGTTACDAYAVDTVNFLQAVVTELDSSADDAVFGLVTFATVAVEQSSGLNDASVTAGVIDGIAALYARGRTATGDGIAECQRVLDGVTDSRPKLLILITDGMPNEPQPVASALTFANTKAQEARDANIVLATVGVGPGIDSANLNNWASSPDLVFEASDFSDLTTIAEEIANTDVCVG